MESIRDAPNHEKGEHSYETSDAFIVAYLDVSIPVIATRMLPPTHDYSIRVIP
jgi:hypothetical protein